MPASLGKSPIFAATTLRPQSCLPISLKLSPGTGLLAGATIPATGPGPEQASWEGCRALSLLGRRSLLTFPPWTHVRHVPCSVASTGPVPSGHLGASVGSAVAGPTGLALRPREERQWQAHFHSGEVTSGTPCWALTRFLLQEITCRRPAHAPQQEVNPRQASAPGSSAAWAAGLDTGVLRFRSLDTAGLSAQGGLGPAGEKGHQRCVQGHVCDGGPGTGQSPTTLGHTR